MKGNFELLYSERIMAKKKTDISSNKKARHDFQIIETWEAGIVLRGTEVKSIREGLMNIRDAYARVENTEVWLYGCDIQPYANASFTQHEAKARRKLLLNKREIYKLMGFTAEKGLTLVALRAYWSGHRVKIELGAGKGKTHVDRRHDLKTRVENREAQRAMSNFNKN